jgi:archaeosortase A (PGF-CTERM-specific)
VPVVTISPLHDALILTVTDHTAWAMNLIGYDPPVVTELSEVGVEREISGKSLDLENSFVFFPEEDVSITYTIVVACTGIGSMAVVGGLVAAVRAPLRRKVRAVAIAIPIIYALNIARNVFIGVSYGNQYAHFFPDPTMTLFALDNDLRVSYIWADRIIAQGLAVIAMILIIWLVTREVPEVMQPVEDVLYLLTGQEYDLAGALGIEVPDAEASAERAD